MRKRCHAKSSLCAFTLSIFLLMLSKNQDGSSSKDNNNSVDIFVEAETMTRPGTTRTSAFMLRRWASVCSEESSSEPKNKPLFRRWKSDTGSLEAFGKQQSMGFWGCRRLSSISATGISLSSSSSSPETSAPPTLPPISPTAKRLFLVRHGEVINPGGDRPVFYGALDVELSPLGKLEATAAADYLKQFDLQHVAASPLQRAIYGAAQIQEKVSSSSDLVILDGFTELNRGAWAGRTKAEIGADNLARFDACDLSVTPEGGESYPDLKERVLKARDELLAMTDPGRPSAIVSHLQVTRSMLSDALGVPTEEMVTLKIATASITCIDFDADGTQTVHFQSFKPEAGLATSKDGAN